MRHADYEIGTEYRGYQGNKEEVRRLIDASEAAEHWDHDAPKEDQEQTLREMQEEEEFRVLDARRERFQGP